MQHTPTEDERPRQSAPRTWVFVLLLMTAGAVLRLHHADIFYYNADEAMHTNIAAAASLAQVLQFSHDEIHPPLLYILCHYWMMISSSPGFVRGLPLLFGLLLIPLYYRIGRLLAGETAGLCCAGFIAFSHGCIIQSCVVRQYIVFLFFISLALFCYLLWRTRPSAPLLAAYGIFAILAASSHFSAAFDIVCLAGYETLRQLLRKEKRLASWLAVNLIAAAFAAYLYHLWQPILVPLKSYFAAYDIAPSERFAHMLAYPIASLGYLLPGHHDALAALVILGLAICAFRKKRIPEKPVTLQGLAFLSLAALLLGMFLLATGIYPQSGSRRSLWLLPLVVPQAGWMTALVLERLLARTKLKYPLAGLIVLVLGMLTYNERARFDDGSEYVWRQDTWHDFERYMEALGPRDLIVTEKDDGIMLANLYEEMGEDAFSGRVMAKLAPYRDTHILFNPYFPRNYSTGVFLATLEQAQEKHLFDDADRIVFLRMAWSRSPLTDLMLCDLPGSHVITFPDFHEAITRDDIERARAAILIIPKPTLLRDVLPGNGKARACLTGAHDMVPDFLRGTP